MGRPETAECAIHPSSSEPVWILSAMQRPTELPVVNVVALVLVQRISGEATTVPR
jgi:hypothetical protein